MLIKSIKNFRTKTREEYMAAEEASMEPWKKRVMRLHEISRFLFYYDNAEQENVEQTEWMFQGELVRGQMPAGGKVYLYSGEGERLGEGIVLSDPSEKEVKRRGFLRPRGNEMRVRLILLDEQPVTLLDDKTLRRMLRSFLQDLSLISDQKMEDIFPG